MEPLVCYPWMINVINTECMQTVDEYTSKHITGWCELIEIDCRQIDGYCKQNDTISVLCRWHPVLMKFVAQLKSKVDNMSAKKRTKTAATGMCCHI